MKQKSNKKMMILSFIGIIIVVLGHTGNAFKLASDIFPYYSFHMALFVFISGYFYNNKYENNVFGKDGYIIKKVKKMLIPYFIWNLIYGIIVNIFKKFNIISYGEKIGIYSYFIRPWTTGHQYILNIAAWFVLALFLVNIIYIIIRKLVTKLKLWNDNVFIIIFLLISILSIYISKKNKVELYIPILRTMFFMFFYHFGYFYKEYIEKKVKINSTIYFMVLILIQLVLFKMDGKLTYEVVFMKFNCKYIITPIIASITGILFWIKISEILVPAIGNSKIVNYISNNTYDIMQHHLFWLFVINLIILKLSNVLNLKGFNIESFRKTIYYAYTFGIEQAKIIYSIIVIAMPLLARYIYETIKLKIKNRKQILEGENNL